MAKSTKLRVLMVSIFPDNEERIVGGVAGVAYYLCQHLKEFDDLELEVLVPHANVEVPEVKSVGGIKVTFLPKLVESSFARIVGNARSRVVNEFIQQHDFDVVHIQGMAYLAGSISIPKVVTIHGINEQDMLYRGGGWSRKFIYPFARALEQKYRRAITNLIVISPYVLEAIGPQPHAKCWPIENPVRSDFFDLKRTPVSNLVFYAGVISSRKNVCRLIQAIAKVRKVIPDVRLRIAGKSVEPEYFETCKRMVSEHSLENTVEFLGSLSINEVQTELQNTHILSLCSHQETAPLIIEEAMAAGVPVVSSRKCGMPYMIEEGVTGELVDPTNVQSIADGIERTLRLDLENAASRSREIAQARFSGASVANRTVEVYREIATRP